jgi:hypothetical protein
MELDETKIDEAVLALLYLTLSREITAHGNLLTGTP